MAGITRIGLGYLGREIQGLSSAMKAGARCARTYKKPVSVGLALGAKKVYRNVGALPIATGVAAAVALPVPGACATGIILGKLINKPLKSLLKLITK